MDIFPIAMNTPAGTILILFYPWCKAGPIEYPDIPCGISDPQGCDSSLDKHAPYH